MGPSKQTLCHYRITRWLYFCAGNFDPTVLPPGNNVFFAVRHIGINNAPSVTMMVCQGEMGGY